jgi:mycofactocin precursor
MTVTTTPDTIESTPTDADAPAPAAAAGTTPLVASDLLVEDVSIDGMCGVY